MADYVIPLRTRPADPPPRPEEHLDTVEAFRDVAREAIDLGWTRERYMARAAEAWDLERQRTPK